MLYDAIKDGADPGANLGADFTASLSETQLIPKGKYLDHFLITIAGTVSTAAVAIETFVGLLAPFIFKAGQETRIQLRARDLIALMAWYYGKTPTLWENTDNTGSDFVMGIKVPIQEVIDPEQVYAWSATRVAQTNISAEKFAMQAVYAEDAKGRNPLVAVELPYTCAAAAGYTNIGVQMPPVGKIIGLMVFQTTIPADGVAAYSIQRIQVLENGSPTSKLLASTAGSQLASVSDGTLSPIQDILKPYSFFDFRDEPLDSVAKNITFSVDVETTSDATRFIAIIEKTK